MEAEGLLSPSRRPSPSSASSEGEGRSDTCGKGDAGGDTPAGKEKKGRGGSWGKRSAFWDAPAGEGEENGEGLHASCTGAEHTDEKDTSCDGTSGRENRGKEEDEGGGRGRGGEAEAEVRLSGSSLASTASAKRTDEGMMLVVVLGKGEERGSSNAGWPAEAKVVVVVVVDPAWWRTTNDDEEEDEDAFPLGSAEGDASVPSASFSSALVEPPVGGVL